MTMQTVDYRDAGIQLRGELYEPASPNGGAVMVVHEADGIGGNVRRRCGLLADLGYVAFAADLHGGGAVLEGDERHEAVAAFLADPESLRRRTAAGFGTMLELSAVDPNMSAAIGYCFGGTAVLELARGGAALAAVLSFHGLLKTRSPAVLGTVKAKVAAFTGALDPLVPSSDVAQFQEEMTRAGADWQLSVYGRAWHSFTNKGVIGSPDERMRYDPAADRLSWTTAMAFLRENLPA